MATTFGKKIPYKQDLPPRSGYPGIEFAKNLPKRGPSGIALFAGCGLVMAYGFANVIMFNRKMRLVYGGRNRTPRNFSERQAKTKEESVSYPPLLLEKQISPNICYFIHDIKSRIIQEDHKLSLHSQGESLRCSAPKILEHNNFVRQCAPKNN